MLRTLVLVKMQSLTLPPLTFFRVKMRGQASGNIRFTLADIFQGTYPAFCAGYSAFWQGFISDNAYNQTTGKTL